MKSVERIIIFTNPSKLEIHEQIKFPAKHTSSTAKTVLNNSYSRIKIAFTHQGKRPLTRLEQKKNRRRWTNHLSGMNLDE